MFRHAGRLRRRGGMALVAASALIALSACGVENGAGSEEESPEITTLPLSNEDLTDVLETDSGVDQDLDACALMDLSVADVSRITGIELDEGAEVGRADVPNQCAYGLPVPPPEDGDDNGAEGDAGTDTETGTAAETTTDAADDEAGADDEAAEDGESAAGSGSDTEQDESASLSPDGDSAARAADAAPNVVTAGAVIPAGDPAEALRLQPRQLAGSYDCSGVIAEGETVPLLPEEETVDGVEPDLGILPFPHVTCDRHVTGGGTQTEVIVLAGGALWHLSAAMPSTERSPTSLEEATDGLLRLSTWLPEDV